MSDQTRDGLFVAVCLLPAPIMVAYMAIRCVFEWWAS